LVWTFCVKCVKKDNCEVTPMGASHYWCKWFSKSIVILKIIYLIFQITDTLVNLSKFLFGRSLFVASSFDIVWWVSISFLSVALRPSLMFWHSMEPPQLVAAYLFFTFVWRFLMLLLPQDNFTVFFLLPEKYILFGRFKNVIFLLVILTIWEREIKCFEAMPIQWSTNHGKWGLVLQTSKQKWMDGHQLIYWFKLYVSVWAIIYSLKYFETLWHS